MPDPPLRHTHADGTTHAHATTLWPAVVELLQLVEDFAAGLPAEAETALRRLLQASLRHEPADWAAEAEDADTAGYQHTWYRAYLAAHHEHPAGQTVAPEAVYVYRPPWWPPGLAHTRAPRPPPSAAGGRPEQALRTPFSPGRLLP